GRPNIVHHREHKGHRVNLQGLALLPGWITTNSESLTQDRMRMLCRSVGFSSADLCSTLHKNAGETPALRKSFHGFLRFENDLGERGVSVMRDGDGNILHAQ